MSKNPGISEFTPEFFDNASKEWRSNKKKINAFGQFKYTCLHHYSPSHKLKQCRHFALEGYDYCKYHLYNVRK